MEAISLIVVNFLPKSHFLTVYVYTKGHTNALNHCIQIKL